MSITNSAQPYPTTSTSTTYWIGSHFIPEKTPTDMSAKAEYIKHAVICSSPSCPKPLIGVPRGDTAPEEMRSGQTAFKNHCENLNHPKDTKGLFVVYTERSIPICQFSHNGRPPEEENFEKFNYGQSTSDFIDNWINTVFPNGTPDWLQPLDTRKSEKLILGFGSTVKKQP